MFTNRDLKNSFDTTPQEARQINELLKSFSRTPQGAFLQELPLAELRFRWCPSMNTDNGVLGAMGAFDKTVYLMPPGYGSRDSFWVKQLFPTVVHELWHYHQRKNHPIRYALFKMRLFRHKIETSADAIEEEAEKWLQSIR